MKCNLLLLTCLLCFSLPVWAQKKDPYKLVIPGSAALRPSAEETGVKFDYKQLNAPLPKFRVYNHENQDITKDVLETGGNLFVMMFNPTCEHCEDQTMLFKANKELFQKSRILLIATPVQVANLGYFQSNTRFSEAKEVMTVSVDSAKIIDKLYQYVEMPQINIYDGKTHRLIKTTNGFQALDSLRQYIQ
jgi:uncharacterized membrane protein